MTDWMICLTKDYQNNEAILRDLVDAVRSYEKGERKSWPKLLAARNRALQHLNRNEKFIDSRPGRDD